MFPRAHLTFALDSVGTNASDALVLASILPDAATTATFSWSLLHESASADLVCQKLDAEGLGDFAHGIQLHNALDERSHENWNGQGGYAFV